MTQSQGDKIRIQIDLDQLEKWSEKIKKTLNSYKCMVQHIAKINCATVN